MELTRLQKALVLGSLIESMEKQGIEVNLKPSEAMKVLTIATEEVEHLSEKEQDEVGTQAFQNAIRTIYDSLVGEQ